MSQVQYALRANFFGYNDETYYVAGHRFEKIYSDLATAKAALFELELDNARQFSLHEVESFFDPEDGFVEKMDAFVFERCGQHIAEDGEVIEDEIPAELSDEDTVAFLNMIGMNSYQLIEVTTDKQFFALWLNQSEQYAVLDDEGGQSLVYAESPEKLLNDHLGDLMYLLEDQFPLNGTLEQLSDSPTLLQAAIDGQKNLSYNNSKHQLNLKNEDVQALRAIHDLLKDPLYEIRTLSLDELMQIEQALAEDAGDWDE